MIRVAFYIVPNNNYYGDYEVLIKKHMKDLKSPDFIPHITYFVASFESKAEAINVFNLSLEGISEITLEESSIEVGESYTKSLFIKFKDINEELKQLYTKTNKIHPHEYMYTLFPHISISYTNVDRELIQKKANAISLKNTIVGFNKFLAVEVPASHTNTSDIESWEILNTLIVS